MNITDKLESLNSLLEDWGCYVPEYFKEKHGFEDDEANLKATVKEAIDTIQRLEDEIGGHNAMQWKPIDTAPRNSSKVLVACWSELNENWKVVIAWWRLPYEGALQRDCYWNYNDKSVMLDCSIHGIGARWWMPIPSPLIPVKSITGNSEED